METWLHAKYSKESLDWQSCHLCFIKVFDTNAVHDSSKGPGSLCLLEEIRNKSITSRKLTLHHGVLFKLKLWQLRKLVCTSCCAVMSWSSSSSPSVNAMITLAVPGRNRPACFSVTDNLPEVAVLWHKWAAYVLPKFSRWICSFAFKLEDIVMVRLSEDNKAFICNKLELKDTNSFKDYPLQSQVHERVAARNLSL